MDAIGAPQSRNNTGEIWEYQWQEVVILVKGISKQVIVVQSPDPELFEQAIFILKEDALRSGGVSEEALLREAKALIRTGGKISRPWHAGPLWAVGGAAATAAVWLLSLL